MDFSGNNTTSQQKNMFSGMNSNKTTGANANKGMDLFSAGNKKTNNVVNPGGFGFEFGNNNAPSKPNTNLDSLFNDLDKTNQNGKTNFNFGSPQTGGYGNTNDDDYDMNFLNSGVKKKPNSGIGIPGGVSNNIVGNNKQFDFDFSNNNANMNNNNFNFGLGSNTGNTQNKNQFGGLNLGGNNNQNNKNVNNFDFTFNNNNNANNNKNNNKNTGNNKQQMNLDDLLNF